MWELRSLKPLAEVKAIKDLPLEELPKMIEEQRKWRLRRHHKEAFPFHLMKEGKSFEEISEVTGATKDELRRMRNSAIYGSVLDE